MASRAAGAVPSEVVRAALEDVRAGRAEGAALSRWVAGGSPLARLLRAVAWAGMGRDSECREDLDAVSRAAPGSVIARTAAARIWLVLGDYPAAFSAVDPDNAPTGEARPVLLEARANLERELGRLVEAHASLASLIRTPRVVERARWHERADEILSSVREFRTALRHIERAIALEPARASLQLRRIELLRQCGLLRDAAAAAATLAAASARSPEERVRAIELLLEADGCAESDALLVALERDHPGFFPAIRLRTTLELWRAHPALALAAANDLIARDANDARAHRLRGGALVLLARFDDAHTALLRALDLDPADEETNVWLAEIALRTGRADDVPKYVTRAAALRPDHLPALLLRQLAALRTPNTASALDPAAFEDVANGLFALAPEARDALARGNAPALEHALETALRALGGNRSYEPTVARQAADGSVSLSRCLAPPGPRFVAFRTIDRVRLFPYARVEAEIDQVLAHAPDSSIALCYRGELRLWVGRYDDAAQDFERAIALRATTRWAYIGLGASQMLRDGRGQGVAISLETFARGVAICGPGPTLFAYRGEALRRAGRPREAVEDLARAVREAPTRVGAWLNLALAALDAGDEPAFASAVAEARRRAPGLISDAALEAGVPYAGRASELEPARWREVFERALGMMRGNRSSGCVTYFAGEILRTVMARPLHEPRRDAQRLDAVTRDVLGSLGLAAEGSPAG